MGLARLHGGGTLDRAGTQTDLTHRDAIFGTISFMAPEQASDPRGVDHRADLYALGGRLHYLLTGRALFPTGNIAEALLAQRDAPIPELRDARPDIPAALDDLFQQLLAKLPENRPASATAVAEGARADCRGRRLVDAISDARPAGRHAAAMASRRRRGACALLRGPGAGICRVPPSGHCRAGAGEAERPGRETTSARPGRRGDSRALVARPGRFCPPRPDPHSRRAAGPGPLAGRDPASAGPPYREHGHQPRWQEARVLRRHRDCSDHRDFHFRARLGSRRSYRLGRGDRLESRRAPARCGSDRRGGPAVVRRDRSGGSCAPGPHREGGRPGLGSRRVAPGFGLVRWHDPALVGQRRETRPRPPRPRRSSPWPGLALRWSLARVVRRRRVDQGLESRGQRAPAGPPPGGYVPVRARR